MGAGSLGTTPVNLGPVPDGTIWVVRDVWYFCGVAGGPSANGLGIYLADGGGHQFAQVDQRDAWGQRTFHFELRQVIKTGEYLQIRAYVAGWTYRISGYQLTTP